jgi:hypothetical protein
VPKSGIFEQHTGQQNIPAPIKVDNLVPNTVSRGALRLDSLSPAIHHPPAGQADVLRLSGVENTSVSLVVLYVRSGEKARLGSQVQSDISFQNDSRA